jgi:predicted amidohydrolase YtcJ
MTIYEGTIITCDARQTVCRYLVEQDGRIVQVNDVDPAKGGCKGAEGAKRIVLGQRVLVPAFADTHIHFSSWSFFLSAVDVRGAASNVEAADLLAEASKASPGRKPLLAFGASAHCVRENRLLSRAELDAVLPQRPVMVFKYDGHACVCNRAMLAALPPEIRIQRGMNEDSGELNQEAFFRAANFVSRSVSSLDLLRGMLRGYDQLAGLGIGMIHSAEGVGFPRDIDVTAATLVARGLKSPFRTRLFFQTMDIDRVLRRRLPRIGGCFATALDGCFGSEDAALFDPYCHNSHNRGVLYYDEKTVGDFCRRANRAGLQVAMHAIGDAAFAQAVAALKAALTDTPREDHRHIIIHACLVFPGDLEECARLGIAIAAQSAFLDWPQEPGAYLQRLLGSRADRLLPLRTMREAGVRISLGSDAPCTAPDPIAWLHKACNHPNAGESVSVADALTMMTREAAWMSFDEKETGSLEAGKWADMVLLSGNPLAVARERLNNLRVETLFLRGIPWQGTGTLPGVVVRGLLRRSS